LELQGEPASAPLARALQAQLAQAYTHRVHVVTRHGARREQGPLAALASVLHLDGLAPGLALAGVDLAQVQHLALSNTAISQAARFHDAPVLVELAAPSCDVGSAGTWPALDEQRLRAATTKVFTTSGSA
jgi:hypothetical protein